MNVTEEKCPKCGSLEFGTARDGIGTRRCACGERWAPIAQGDAQQLAKRVRELEAERASMAQYSVPVAMVLVRGFQAALDTTWSWEVEATFALMIAGEEPTPERVAELAAKLERDDIADAADDPDADDEMPPRGFRGELR